MRYINRLFTYLLTYLLTYTGVPQNVFFVFLMQFWASVSGGFRIVSDTLVVNVQNVSGRM